MELTRITKLLLWLLSKRPDVGALTVRESELTDYLQVPEDLLLDEMYEDLTPEQQHYLQVDFLHDCFSREQDDSTA